MRILAHVHYADGADGSDENSHVIVNMNTV